MLRTGCQGRVIKVMDNQACLNCGLWQISIVQGDLTQKVDVGRNNRDETGTLTSAFEKSGLVTSFVVDGIIGGVGSVLVFIPDVFLLFLAISFSLFYPFLISCSINFSKSSFRIETNL